MSTIQTHKEIGGFGADFKHDWPVTSVPKNPEFYQPVPAPHDKGWSHLIDMMKKRKIPWEVVGETIRHGDVHLAEGENRYRFLWTCPNTRATFSAIVELRAEAFAYDDYKHYVITIYRVET